MDHHRFLLRMHLDQLTALDQLITRLNARIAELMAPFGEAVKRLMTIPRGGPPHCGEPDRGVGP
jgi:transposase